ncbi:MAG: hypothetical protein KBB75_02210 [Candidatus Pacebacteria bacterium]|nr:hypothetical protein [Candidatus Paceibacterota bacterium]
MDTKKYTLKKVLWWIALSVLFLFLFLLIVGLIHTNSVEKTKKAVDTIHSTKLTLDDVTGKNLPPDPGVEADTTVQGIDANKNNIRDDVELAIFKEYPNSAKTRAVLLQYALALQMEMTQDLVNTETVTAVAEKGSSAYLCIGEVFSRDNFDKYKKEVSGLRDFVELKQLNTDIREKTKKDFYKFLTSGSIPSDNFCDIDNKILKN